MRIALLSRNATLYSTSRLVLAARARGHEVHVLDPLELQIVVSGNRSRLCQAGRTLPAYDAVVPRIGASVTRYGLAVVRAFEEQGAAMLNPSEALALARDKVRSLAVLAQAGVRVPKTVAMRSLNGVASALRLVGGCPVIVKLPQGTQGVGTMIAETPKALHSLVETLWAMGHELVLQEYIRESGGRDIRALVVGGKVVASMRRTAQRGEFRSNLHRGARGESVELARDYKSCAVRSARVLGLELTGVDILEGRGGPVVVELNGSPGLEGIEQVTGVDVATRILERAEAMHARRRSAPRSRRRPKAAWS
jgi:ribosomal protein S6--L-glutamate ligase